MCDEIEDPRVRSTLGYLIRNYNSDDNTVEVHLPTGEKRYVNFINIQESLAVILGGQMTDNGDLVLNFYINSDDQVVNDFITIKLWETKWWVGEIA
ncbi:hypothetical protein DS739_10855 [Acetobacter sp. JWB]|nr:hypothetical protein CPF11_09550 [Acetobacter pomorum]AXC27194.1 hypothetical protein DS739_10855 [Acetobacter sp. JWB]